jgi:CHAT domain-containing protein
MDKLTVFIALTGIAVLLQACVLLAMYITMRKSGERMEALVAEVKTKLMPTVEQAQALLIEIRPKLEVITENVAESTTTIRAQVQRVDATVNDVVDRARLQIIRADELLSRTLDRVEQTSEMVHNTVISPVRQLSGIMQGITVGLDFLFRTRNRKNGGGREERRPVPQDEMFI